MRVWVQWSGLVGGPVLAAAVFFVLPATFSDDQGQLVPAKHVTTRVQNRHCFKVREVLE